MFNPLGGGRVQDSTDNKMMGKNSFSRLLIQWTPNWHQPVDPGKMHLMS